MRHDFLPDQGAVIKGDHYRLTLLTPRMVRLEYSETDEFTDLRTQTVTSRRFPVPEFTIKETEQELTVITEFLRVKYNKKKFSAEGLQIFINGQFACYSSVWNYGDAPRDLKGTARTLDEADGAIPLESGILSARGWSLLDDSGTLLINEEGWIEQRKDRQAKDLYFLGYGRDYLACLKDFHRLTGQVPLLPRFALGNWWSRYYRYSEKTYLDLMDRFEREEIPFTVAVIDMDWHLTEVDPRYGTGWTGYTWNRELFPQPERFLGELHRRNMKVTLNVHPADGVRAFEDCYPALAEYMGADAEHEEPVEFQIGNARFVKGYFEYVHHPLERQGVDFWWIDWQQGTNSGIEGLDPLWMLNHFHYLDSCREHKRGLIFSRYAGPGSHRYPVGFSGDTIISWASLQFQPYFTLTASNIGYGWWSHDIGGHMRGIKDDELAVRWLQFGVFSPITRLHSSSGEFNGKEPWRYNKTAETVMKKFLRLRHKMLPYLYTMNLRANTDSIPLMQPLYYQHPFSREAYQVKNEYYFGSEMIVCPITERAGRQSHMASFLGWLPEGTWTDLFTGMVYEGNRMTEFNRDISAIPVFMKAGAILPLDGNDGGNSVENPEKLEICVSTSGNGTFALWEDDGEEAEFVPEKWARTDMAFELSEDGEKGKTAVFSVKAAEGNRNVIPAKRSYTIHFYGLSDGAVLSVRTGDGKTREAVSEYDESKGILTVSVSKIETQTELTVRLENILPHDNQKMKRIFEYLDAAEIEFEQKTKIYETAGQIENGRNTAYVMEQMLCLDVEQTIQKPVLEILSSRV